MEGMNLSKLEAVVEKLLSSLQEIKQENAALQSQLEAKKSKISELESKVTALTSNQDEVSSRVTNLLSSIEDWEKSLGAHEEDADDAPAEEDEPAESRGGDLFSLGG